MGIFNGNDKSNKDNKGATIIAKGTYLIGGINTKGTVHIDGRFEGVILDADIISIGISGEVIGDIKANDLIISGLLDGKVDCNEVHIMNSGTVLGEVKYNKLIVEPDAKFEAKGIRKGSNLVSNYNKIEDKITNIIKNPNPLELE